MSRLGKLPIKLPAETQAKIEGDFIIVKGPKGELKEKIHKLVNIDIKEEEIIVSVKDAKNKKERALWGLFRSLINNMVQGVNQDFEKKLEVVGVGYRVSLSGKELILNVGYSHPVSITLPEGINAEIEGNIITISGISKQQVGEIAAQIRKVKKPEPYKGKGIKYQDEIIRRKEGKTAAKGE
ncbi:50S ribosomal protein L6 [Candidatus Falkowbacteria bacterium]|nr:MAG: 50S ribosomal protein L6 [Candidatus Falkowbacteria bacterium]